MTTRYAIQLADFMVLCQHDPALGIVLAANAERQSVRIGKERFWDTTATFSTLPPSILTSNVPLSVLS